MGVGASPVQADHSSANASLARSFPAEQAPGERGPVLSERERGAGEKGSGLSEREKLRQEKIEEFRDRFANPYIAADRGFLDAVIQPRETRKKLIQALEMLETKRDKNPPKKHGNIPL